MTLGSFLDGRQPDRLRGLQMLALADRGSIQQRVSVDDAGGGVTQTWTVTETGVPCRIAPLSGTRGMTAERIDERSTHTVTVPAGTDITAADRFDIDDRGTYEVTAARERTNERTRVFEVVRID